MVVSNLFIEIKRGDGCSKEGGGTKRVALKRVREQGDGRHQTGV